MRSLVALYDGECGFCRMIAARFSTEPAYLDLEFLSAQSVRAAMRFPDLCSDKPDELVVIDDEGGVYRSTDAYIMVLYALKGFRKWSLRLATPLLKPLARNLFLLVARNRHALSALFHSPSDPDIAEELQRHEPVRCSQESTTCRK
jgi:predicted DCC family thiol-disulfide oxidoreductase YuxK